MGVRVVSALAAALVVAASLVVAGAALVLLVGQSLRHNAEDDAEQRAEMIASRLDGNYRSSPNENAREALDALTTPDDLVQIIVRYGTDPGETESRVIEAGTDAVGGNATTNPGVRPISSLVPDDGQMIVRPDTPITRADGGVVQSVLVAIGTESDGTDIYVLLAVPLTAVQEATETVLFYLLWGVPLLIVVAGLATYLFSGRALRPVEAIRTQVAAMTEKDLAQRVPVPTARDEVGRLAETMNGMIARLQDAQASSAGSSPTRATSCAARSPRSRRAWSSCRTARPTAPPSRPCAVRPPG
ncbi:hypothetical protein BJF78_16385 [Pseudonocardia sp. CNS-139]|nr:hypothetical protein BJF78_16385 [Pseudonocardia sp. CNS-139]